MPKPALRFRQIHLDFHTSGAIPDIGKSFDKAVWQERLRLGHVDSITLFARCHHGWCYYPSQIGPTHPHLDFDLFGEQVEACHEIGVNAPAYITAGWDEEYAYAHPGHLEVPPAGIDPTKADWKRIAFHQDYIDYLCAITEEVVKNYPVDGIFYDIVGLTDDLSLSAQTAMREQNLDPLNPQDRLRFARQRQQAYFQATNAAIHKLKPDMRIFHNAGHIPKGDRSFLKYASHLEIESLPTGGWGYDHMPLSAKYAATQKGVEYLGMTGKFHTSWGEFGGFKHPNALRYECAAMLAFGCKCSIGDQLHPSGELNLDTYQRIGLAYSEVEAKEPWCTDVIPVSEVALLTIESLPRDEADSEHFGGLVNKSDMGASRMLLERQIQYDAIDIEADFSDYRLIILPDDGYLQTELADKLNDYLCAGGKLLLSGNSGRSRETGEFLLPGIGKVDTSAKRFDMEYIRIDRKMLQADTGQRLIASPFVTNGENLRVTPAKGATVLAEIINPYFSRTFEHFCSHQHAPEGEASGYPALLVNEAGNIAYFAPKIFVHYTDRGQYLYRELVVAAIDQLLGGSTNVQTSLQSAGRVSLMEQPAERRYVLHLLYASPTKRGQNVMPKWGIEHVEVVEDIPTLADIAVSLRLQKEVTSVKLAPSGEILDFTIEADRVNFTLPKLECHQMIELGYA